jgi:hypothetical protein
VDASQLTASTNLLRESSLATSLARLSIEAVAALGRELWWMRVTIAAASKTVRRCTF